MTAARDFVWFTVRDRSNGSAHSEGFWSDVTDVQADVIDPLTGATVSRLFYGGAGLVEISPITMAANLVVQTVEMTLSQIDDRIANLIRGYDPKQGRLTIFRGKLDPATGALLAAAKPIFFGRINDVTIDTPAEGGTGGVAVSCVTATQEIMRASAATRSDADQRRRKATDNFFQDAGTAGLLEIYWGSAKP